MRYSRIAVVLAVVTVASGGLTTGTSAGPMAGAAVSAPARVLPAPGALTDGVGDGVKAGDGERAGKRCRYAVRRVETRLNVRRWPGTRYRVVDKLYPGDYTWGSCRKFGRWRKVRGVDAHRRGFSHKYYLKRIDTR
jgi:hypothetical protein